MSEPEPPSPGDRRGDVWDYVRRRSELDQEIRSRFTRPVTVMFTDIKGSTTVFDLQGDLEGVTMLQRHNERVRPAIDAAGGHVVKALGDGLMVTFPTPADAVRAAVEIQRTLHTYNEGRAEREQIQLRIGINTGVGIVEKDDVFGDVVNAAARIQGLAEPGQILVSDTVYAEARGEIGTASFQPLGPAALKGRAGAVPLFEVEWRPETSRVRAARPLPGERARVFVLELSQLAGRLKVSSYEHVEGEEETLRTYDEGAWDEAALRPPVERIHALLEAGGGEARLTRGELDELASQGRLLYEQALPPQARLRLEQSTATDLRLVLDDQLVQIPWELLHDGREFLCLRFGVGRLVSTSRPSAAGQPREVRSPLRVAIVADPRSDLPEARREGELLAARLGAQSEFEVSLSDAGVGRERFLQLLQSSDVLHFAGHGDYEAATPGDASFLLADGRLPATELLGRVRGGPVPRLLFMNACHSGQTVGWTSADPARVFGLASAMLLSGVKHYVGSLRPVEDRAGFLYAVDFYDALRTGASIGTAVREARRSLARRDGQTSPSWATYVLYGEPTARYAGSGAVAAAPRDPRSRRRRWLAVGAAGLAGLGLVALFFRPSGVGAEKVLAEGYRKLEAGQLQEASRDFQAVAAVRPAAGNAGLAAVAFRQDDLTTADTLCRDALQRDAGQPACLLIRGDLQVVQGDLGQARTAYEAVAAQSGAAAPDRATAYNRLGRLQAAAGHADDAATSYTRAQELDPRNWESLANLGALRERQGRPAEALTLLEKAATIRPGDPLIEMLLGRTRAARDLSADRERQRRVDELVAELARQYRQGDAGRSAAPADTWTSRPLTMTLTPFESRGRVAFREGEHELLLQSLGQVLAEGARVRLVERAVMDKLLGELKLGSSALADPATALRLGRLLSARLISVGTIAGTGSSWQLTVRLIETETSVVAASTAQTFPLSVRTTDAAEQAGRRLVDQVARTFPLRARVVQARGGEVTLNVGTAEGAAPGLRLELFREGAQGQREVVNEAEVTDAGEGRSRARLRDERAPVAPGLKAEQLR